MSTRSQIGIYADKKNKIDQPYTVLYKHSDGYIEGTLPLLEEFAKKFKTNRGFFDEEYFGARLIQFLTNQSDDHLKKWQEQRRKETDISPFDMCGYGICGDKMLHGDIEYYYAIYEDRIEVYETHMDCEFKDMTKPIKISKI